MHDQLATLDVVALLTEFPEQGLVKGQVGTVVLELPPDHVEVEFVDERGATYALAPIPSHQLIRLHYQRVQAA